MNPKSNFTEKCHNTPLGTIHYWTSDRQHLPDSARELTLVFLPGLTADHRLFDKQLDHFSSLFHCLVWDAPGHGASRPFRLEFSLDDKARFLHEILVREKVQHPVLIGQSMGGYVAQMLIELYPGQARGFVSIDSASLKRKYITAAELWALHHVESIYRLYPWQQLVQAGICGCSVSEYGQMLMKEMLSAYSRDEYCALAGHGMRILAQAIASDREYAFQFPAILICGRQDKAGSARRYNKAWSKTDGLPLFWIEQAGHNSNTDQPEAVNQIIEDYLQRLP